METLGVLISLLRTLPLLRICCMPVLRCSIGNLRTLLECVSRAQMASDGLSFTQNSAWTAGKSMRSWCDYALPVYALLNAIGRIPSPLAIRRPRYRNTHARSLLHTHVPKWLRRSACCTITPLAFPIITFLGLMNFPTRHRVWLLQQ